MLTWLTWLILSLHTCGWVHPVAGGQDLTNAEVSQRQFKQSSIYEIMTDRFNNPSGNLNCFTRPDTYCGGTFDGIRKMIGYLQQMNFRAVWITPFVTNGPNGYHGYWSLDLYSINAEFGTEAQFTDLLQALEKNGISAMLDLVFNHMGYGSAYPSYYYYYNPFNQKTYFHPCDICMKGTCSVPYQIPDTMTEEVYEKLWTCRLQELPDIDQRNSTVSEFFVNWMEYLKGKYNFKGIRYDAIPYIYPEFLERISQKSDLFGLGEILLDPASNGTYQIIEKYLTYGGTMESSNQSRRNGSFSQLDYMYTYAALNCFAAVTTCCPDDPTIGCRQISKVRKIYNDMGANQKLMGRFLDSADVPRFLQQYNSTVSLMNALALIFLGEGIPILWQGTEQGMGSSGPSIYKSRDPVWLVGFSTNAQLFVYIRMLNYYRYWLDLWDQDMEEAFVDQNSFAFSMKTCFVVLTNGNATQDTYILTNLPAGKTYCSLQLYQGQKSGCLTIPESGSVTIAAEPAHYPMIFVEKSWSRNYETYFTPWEHWSVEWEFGVLVSSLLLPFTCLVALVGLQFLTPDKFKQWVDRATERFLESFMIVIKPDHNSQTAAEDLYSLGSEVPDEMTLDSFMSSQPTEYADDGAMPAFISHRVQVDTPLWQYANAYTEDENIVWHLALEYAIPHLGMRSQLMFGGLGKVVEMFIEYATRPIVVCAPLYRTFYDDNGKLLQGILGKGSQTITTLPVEVDTKEFSITLHLVVPDEDSPMVFYMLLDCFPLFGWRNKAQIYSFQSEFEQLQYFSAYSQVIGFLLYNFKVKAAQMHDNHAALSLEHIKPSYRPATLITLHNGDYNTSFKLGTEMRESYVYNMFSLVPNTSLKARCEHMGSLDFLHLLVGHCHEFQDGYGMVAVSAKYSERCHRKFSRFWSIPKTKVIGILNGMNESERVMNIPENFDEFFKAKAEAKEKLQDRLHLVRNSDMKLLVFFGRVTHQKGCDLIAKAAPELLRANPHAQLVMAGPIGDSFGSKTAEMMKNIVHQFPGRVADLVGQYIAGDEKDELILACDFFLCPSRFEPCGLADIEMGWMGAVMIGHATGGLQKMPGFYFKGELDNEDYLAMQLADTVREALRAEPDVIRAMAQEAMLKSFPPEQMIEAYEQVWSRLIEVRFGKRKNLEKPMADVEESFYEKVWKIDNQTLKDTQKIEDWSISRAWWSNLFLLVSQSFFRLPSLVCLIWVQYALNAGQVNYQVNEAAVMPTFLKLLLIYLGISILTTPCWQLLCWKLSPKHYILLCNGLNVISWLCALWSFWAPPAMIPLFIVTVVFGNSAVSFIGLIFLDVEGKVSVSQDGIKLMGFSDIIWYIILAIAYALADTGNEISRLGLEVTGIIFLVLSVCLALYFASPHSLPPHFRHFRLRFRGQLEMLVKNRKAWLAFSTISTIDAFNLIFLLGAIFEFVEDDTIVYTSYILLAFTTGLSTAGAAFLLSTKFGARGSIKLFYAMALFPFMTLFQLLVIVYAPSWATLLAATILNAFSVRTQIMGVLSLHSLPSREVTLTVTNIQVILGSFAIALATIACWKLNKQQIWVWILISALFEIARLIAGIVFIGYHKKENLASP